MLLFFQIIRIIDLIDVAFFFSSLTNQVSRVLFYTFVVIAEWR